MFMWDILHKMCFQCSLDRVADYRVDQTDQTQAAGRQDATRAKDAGVGREWWLLCGYGLSWVGRGWWLLCGYRLIWVGGCHRGLCGGDISDIEASRLSRPIFQSKGHGQILTYKETQKGSVSKSAYNSHLNK